MDKFVKNSNHRSYAGVAAVAIYAVVCHLWPDRSRIVPQPDVSGQAGLSYTFEEVPSYLQSRFIQSGYRAHLTLTECAWSIFRLHNETVNIWTHLLAAVIFWRFAWIHYDTKKHPVVISLLCGSKALVFTASFFAHTFCPINEEWYKLCWRLDWSAIAISILGTCATVTACGFHRHPAHRNFWIVAFVASTCVMLAIFNLPSFQRLPKVLKLIGVMIPVPCILGLFVSLYMVLPSNRMAVIRADMTGPIVLLVIGLWIWAGQMPERWLPGYFDLTGGSHTFHHAWSTGFAYLMLKNALRWSRLWQLQ